MANTFSEQYMAEISRSGYVTDNPHSATVLENDLTERFQGHRKDITKLQRYGQYDIVPVESHAHIRSLSKSTGAILCETLSQHLVKITSKIVLALPQSSVV